MDMCIFF